MIWMSQMENTGVLPLRTPAFVGRTPAVGLMSPVISPVISVVIPATIQTGQLHPIVSAVAKDKLEIEINRLPASCKLTSGRDFDVFCARAKQIPLVLREIGRTREMTFRAIGEGTGKSIDLDEYDAFYLHLFLWDRKARKVAGAYRLGLSDELLLNSGKKSFYSHSCFKIRRRFFDKLGPSIELGRSFVRQEYQRNVSPLLLLWKGIGCFVAENPQYSKLFGPVSMSNDYSSLSRQLVVDYLMSPQRSLPLAKYIKPRALLHQGDMPFWTEDDLAKIDSFGEISELVSLLENDGKGAPVLFRHYINMGGRFLGFSVDKHFASSLDGLVVVDLLRTNPLTLTRYMGNKGARTFYNYHQTDRLN